MIRIRGFTLVELLVVISIIGILASVVTVNANVARRLSRDSKRKADIQNVAGALELYRASSVSRTYPKAPTKYTDLTSVLSGLTSNIPVDPSYVYVSDNSGAHFFLDVALENKSEPKTINSAPGNDPVAANFVTGTYDLSGIAHYRVSGP